MEAAGWNTWDNFKAFVYPHFCTWRATLKTLRRHTGKLLLALPFGVLFALGYWWKNR